MDMDNRTIKMGMLLTILVSGLVIAQREIIPIPVKPANFRLEVRTGRPDYFDRDVLRITVELLNNGEQQLMLVPDLPDVVEPVDLDAGQIIPGRMDDTAVNAIILPEEKPLVIGTARLIPLQRPWMKTQISTDAVPVAQREYKLPLFGSAVVPPHSTRVISTIRILLTAPVDVEPQPSGDTTTPVENVDVEGRWIIPWPGEYLLDCAIDKIAGVPAAQAQTIVRVTQRKPLPQPAPVIGLDDQRKILDEHKTLLNQIREQLRMADGKQNSLLAYARLQGKYLNVILRILLGAKPDQPVDPVVSQPGAASTPAVAVEPAARMAVRRQ
jgi:hypothetical protein